MVWLVVLNWSVLPRSHPEYGGPCRCAGNTRRCKSRLTEDVIRADDAAAVTFFVSVDEGRARQRYRGPETDGGATRRRQREALKSLLVSGNTPRNDGGSWLGTSWRTQSRVRSLSTWLFLVSEFSRLSEATRVAERCVQRTRRTSSLLEMGTRQLEHRALFGAPLVEMEVGALTTLLRKSKES